MQSYKIKVYLCSCVNNIPRINIKSVPYQIMKNRMLKLKNWLLMSLLSWLGFSGCRSAKEVSGGVVPNLEPEPRPRSEIALMYGVPTANYHVVGRVVDTKDTPLRGIQILRLERGMDATPDSVVGDPDAIRRYTDMNAVTTAVDGTFQMDFTDRPYDELRLLVRDVDGEANGSYRNQIYTVDVNSAGFRGGKGWNAGSATLNVTIPMEER